MRWPWQRREERQSTPLDTLLESLILTQAESSSIPSRTATGAFEAGCGVIARAFASATVEGPDALAMAVTPEWLATMARSLCRNGEFLAAIDVGSKGLHLTPCASWNVTGDPDPDSWTYRLYMAGPSYQVNRMEVPASAVVHIRYAVHPVQPWRGLGPIQLATLAGRLSAETVTALADESNGAHGMVLPMPVDGQDPTVTQLKADLKRLKGQLALVESVRTMATGAPMPASDWVPQRIGANPPASLVALHEIATREVLAALGIPPVLFGSNPNGTAGREAWRQLLFAVVAPLGRLVMAELEAKLEAPIVLSWDELRASDIAGRARAFQSMVSAGMDPAKAAGLAGLMETQE